MSSQLNKGRTLGWVTKRASGPLCENPLLQMVKADQAWDRLCRAVKINNKERVEELLDLHYRDGDVSCPGLAADHEGWTLLILAASRGHWELVNTVRHA